MVRFLRWQTCLRNAVLFFGIIVLTVTGRGEGAWAQNLPIVADLSKHLVAITTGFSGSDVLLFGATDGPGDIILVVRGPTTDITVRKKGRFGPVWANRDSVEFRSVPSFYQVASTRPLDEIVNLTSLRRHQIGFSNLEIKATEDAPPKETAAFRDALVRLKSEQGLFGMEERAVSTLANRLFRADLRFPANVPTGTYSVEVYLVRDREIENAEITPLIVGKVGLSAEIAWFAQEYAALYGIGAILAAIVAGWIAGFVFREA